MKTLKRLSIVALPVFAAISANAASAFDMGEDAQLHFVADVSFVYEDNLFRRSSQEDSDMHLRFSPGIELRMSPDSAASTTISYRHHFNRYQDFSELDEDFSDFRFSSKYDSGVILSSVYANYLQSYSNTYDFDQASDIFGVLIKRDTTSAGGSMRYELSELTAVKVGVDYQEVDYAGSNYIDHESFSVPVNFFYKVRPKVDLTAGIRYRDTDTSQGIEYKDLYYFVGAIGEVFSPVVYADLSIGYQDRSADFGTMSFPDTDDMSYKMSLIYTGNPKSTVYATLSRDYNTSAFNGSSYSFTSASLGARYSVSNSVGLSASIAAGETSYESNPLSPGVIRSDDLLTARLGASYRPNDYLTVKASYVYRDVDGNVANYSQNEFRVTASLRY